MLTTAWPPHMTHIMPPCVVPLHTDRRESPSFDSPTPILRVSNEFDGVGHGPPSSSMGGGAGLGAGSEAGGGAGGILASLNGPGKRLLSNRMSRQV